MTPKAKILFMRLMQDLCHTANNNKLKLEKVVSEPNNTKLFITIVPTQRVAVVNFEKIACERTQVYVKYARGDSNANMQSFLVKPEEKADDNFEQETLLLLNTLR